MTNEISVPQGFATDIANPEEDDFQKIAKSSSWLPRIQLMNGLSGLVTDGKMSVGAYAVITDKELFTDVGKEFNGLVFCWRPKALDFSNGVVNCYDPNTPMWDDIVKRSRIKDSQCSYGPEFLCWIPGLGYVTYFANSATARKSCVALRVIIKEFSENSKLPAFTMKSSIRKGGPGGNKKWWGADILPCSTPFAEGPDWEVVKEQAATFRNPPKATVEKVAEGDEGSSDRD